MKPIIYSLLLSLLIFPSTLSSQNSEASKTTLKIGVGNVFLGTGDMHCIQLENEIEHRLTKKFSGSASINLGTSYSGIFFNTSYAHSDVRVLYAPFGNERLVSFKVGAGISYMYEDRVVYNGSWSYDGQNYYDISEERIHQVGGIFSLSGDMPLSDRYSVGVNAFIQPYTDNMMSGISIRGGIKL